MVVAYIQLLEIMEYDKYPKHVPNYLSITTMPPRRPPRHFCVVCGEAGPYTHPLDGARYEPLDLLVPVEAFMDAAVLLASALPSLRVSMSTGCVSSLPKAENATRFTLKRKV